MTFDSQKLNEVRENQEFTLPDWEILDLYNGLDPAHQDDFKTYVQNKLKKDPWAQPIIEKQITTNHKASEIIKNIAHWRARQYVWLQVMKAANDADYGDSDEQAA